VITTYDRVRAEYKRGDDVGNFSDRSPLFNINWRRIVLDEAHKVRSGSLLFDAVRSLESRFKWCLTGTPFQVLLKQGKIYIPFCDWHN
jgi:SNF2 family DNA or RNA helicase